MSRTKPYAPPFKIGTRIRYVGTSSFSYGGNPMIESGDEGVVVETVEGTWGRPDLGPDLAEPGDGWSVVVIKGNRLAVSRPLDGRYVQADR